MAVSIADIQKLRAMSGAGLADCKKALTESEGDIEKAMEIIRKKGQAVAAKRSDREASEGCVLVKADGKFAAIIALKCETDFVAQNADFVALTQQILDAAVAARCQTLDEVKALDLGGRTVADAVVDRSGITGEKMELDGYCTLEGEQVSVYNHQNKNGLCTMVALNMDVDPAYGHAVTMQVAAMNPVALNEASVPAAIIEQEKAIAIDKTRKDQVDKYVEVKLKKAGYNPYYCATEEHQNEAVMKGYMTPEQVADAKAIMEAAAAEKLANMPQAMIDNIVNGRIQKFYKESCLMNQAFIQDDKITVAQYLQQADKACVCTGFKRFTLRAE